MQGPSPHGHPRTSRGLGDTSVAAPHTSGTLPGSGARPSSSTSSWSHRCRTLRWELHTQIPQSLGNAPPTPWDIKLSAGATLWARRLSRAAGSSWAVCKAELGDRSNGWMRRDSKGPEETYGRGQGPARARLPSPRPPSPALTASLQTGPTSKATRRAPRSAWPGCSG